MPGCCREEEGTRTAAQLTAVVVMENGTRNLPAGVAISCPLMVWSLTRQATLPAGATIVDSGALVRVARQPCAWRGIEGLSLAGFGHRRDPGSLGPGSRTRQH